MSTSILYQEIVGGTELKYVMDIITQGDWKTCKDLFYDLQILHTQVHLLDIDEIHLLSEYVHATLY